MSATDLEWLPEDALQACHHLLQIVREQHQRIAYLENMVIKLVERSESLDLRIAIADKELCRLSGAIEELS